MLGLGNGYLTPEQNGVLRPGVQRCSTPQASRPNPRASEHGHDGPVRLEWSAEQVERAPLPDADVHVRLVAGVVRQQRHLVARSDLGEERHHLFVREVLQHVLGDEQVRGRKLRGVRG